MRYIPLEIRLLIYLAATCLPGCVEKEKTSTLDEKIPAYEIISEWHVIGPFINESGKQLFDNDLLSEYNASETKVSIEALQDIDLESKKNSSIQIKAVSVDTSLLNLNELFGLSEDKTPTAAAYLISEIQSKEERYIYINTSSDDHAKVWVNGILVDEIFRLGPPSNYERYSRVPLKKGSNTLAIKCVNDGGGWQAFVRIEPDQPLDEIVQLKIPSMDQLPKEGIAIKKWHSIGPFPNKSESPLDVDHLERWDQNEDDISYVDFINISATNQTNPDSLHPEFECQIRESMSEMVDINSFYGFHYNKTISGNVYLATQLFSEKPQKLRLNFSSDDNAKVWLNGKEIIRLEKADVITKYEKYVSIDLKKGKNFLLVKINNGLYGWEVFARIEKETSKNLIANQRLTFRFNNHTFLDRSFLDSSFVLKASPRLPSQGIPLEILNTDLEVVKTSTIHDRSWSIDLSGLSSGAYYARIKLNKDTLEQVLFKGDFIEQMKVLIQNLKSSKNDFDNETNNTIEANVFRFNHLLKPSHRGSNPFEHRAWQRKMIYLYLDLVSIKKLREENGRPLMHNTGIKIRTYTSTIDDGTQYYMIHVPKKYDPAKPSSLAVYTPAILSDKNRKYLQSMRVADMKLIENIQDMSEKYNIITVRPFMREVGKSNYNGIDERDVLEVLAHVKKNYTIDEKRISLIGTCAGAFKALRMAVRYPSAFHKMAVVGSSFSEQISNEPWDYFNQPLHYLSNISNIPTLLIHAADDEHISVEHSDNLVSYASKMGMTNIQYQRPAEAPGKYYWDSYSHEVYEFITNESAHTQNPPDHINFTTNRLKYNSIYWLEDVLINSIRPGRVSVEIKEGNSIEVNPQNVLGYSINLENSPLNTAEEIKIYENGQLILNGLVKEKIFTRTALPETKGIRKNKMIEGPFASLFLNRFIVVIGTNGSNQERKAVRNLASTIQREWQRKYENGCLTKYDYQITQKDIASSNLLLIGNQHSNLLMKKIYSQLPLNIRKEGVTIGNVSAQGKTGFYVIHPNPLNVDKYVGIIGYNDPSFVSIGDTDMSPEEYEGLMSISYDRHLDISTYGWYDYKVWNEAGKTLQKGYFTIDWKN